MKESVKIDLNAFLWKKEGYEVFACNSKFYKTIKNSAINFASISFNRLELSSLIFEITLERRYHIII